MDTQDQNKAFEAAKERVLAAREKMAECMEEVLVVGMSISYLRGKKKNESAIGELLNVNAEENTILVRKGRIIESVDVIQLTEILDCPEPFEGFDDDEPEDSDFAPNTVRLGSRTTDDPDTSHGWRGANGEPVSAREFEEGMARRDSMSPEELEVFARKMSGYTGPPGGPANS